MNFLFHLYLSGNDQELLVGNFMGDFVKGRLSQGDYPPKILDGLLLHRKIDSFAQVNSSFQTSRRRLPERFGLYRGILVDMFYDHFLASQWSTWSRRSFEEYLHWVRIVVNHHLDLMPDQLQEFCPVICNELLPSYRTVPGIGAALSRMSRHVSRNNPLAEGTTELERQYEQLKADFETFMPAVQRFVATSFPNASDP